jgi:hypothetical protein
MSNATPERIVKRRDVEGRNWNQQRLKQLLAYSAVAGATVAMSPSTANAEVVFTWVNKYLDLDYYLDLNHDGIADFTLYSYYLSEDGKVRVYPLDPNNAAVASTQHCSFTTRAATPLPDGAVIGPKSPIEKGMKCLASIVSSFSVGPWFKAHHKYLGLAFQIDGKQHFGWARLTWNQWTCYKCVMRIEGYAYETIPGKPILAGDIGEAGQAALQPAILGALASGSVGLPLWRKEPE